MPWFGLFRKISGADTWVVLDHVTNNPRDANFWGRRVRILINGEPKWLSVPLRRPELPGVVGIPISAMKVNLDDPKVLERNWRTVQMAYAKAPFFELHEDLVKRFLTSDDPSLMMRNLAFIESVMQLLGINTRMVLSSSLNVGTSGSEMLVDIIKLIGGSTYLHGTGASGYQKDQMFYDSNIELQANTFEHPEYFHLRTEKFFAGLSIIDMLFNARLADIQTWVTQQ